MAKFVKEDSSNLLLNRSSQLTIDQLQGITAVDLALAIPYIKITKIDPETRLPARDIPPLNVFFQKPPEFGKSLTGRYPERPPVSLESFVVSTKQNYGIIIEQHIEMKIIAHRPSAIFDDEDSMWASIITPGDTHLVEYGWTGSSKNGLINGDGFDDTDVLGGSTFIPSRKSILFSTYYYTFAIRNTGEIEFTVKGMQNGNLVFRQIQLGDVLDINTDLQTSNTGLAKVPHVDQKDSVNNEKLRARLQFLLKSLSKEQVVSKRGLKPVVKLIDVLNILLAETITVRTQQWGYDKIDLVLGKFNPNVPPTSEQFSSPTLEIADFMIPLDSVKKIIKSATRKNTSLTIENFIQNLLTSTVNNAMTWAPGKQSEKSRLSARIPQVIVKVVDESTTSKKRIRISIFDSIRDLIALFPDENRLYGKDLDSRKKIKDRLRNAKIPFISFGHANSFIVDSNFDVMMDSQIQRAKIDTAAKYLKTRSNITSKSLRDILKEAPNEYHQIFSSTIQGTMTTIGHFAFETFSTIWLDFQVNIWDGPFVIRQKTDTISAAGFESTIEVISEGTDVLNTKRRLSKDQITSVEEVRLATRSLSEARSIRGASKKKAAIKSAQDRLTRANTSLKQASIPRPKRPKGI